MFFLKTVSKRFETTHLIILSLVVVVTLSINNVSAQGVGFSPNMDGGFENQVSSGAAAVLQSVPSNYFTVNNSGSVLSFLGGGGRSGQKHVSWTVSGSSSNGFYTPSDVSNSIMNSTSYVVQFYYKNSSASNTKSFNVSISPDGINAFGSATNSGTLTQTTWTKVSLIVNSGSSGSNQNGTIRFVPNSTFSSPFYLDDIVVYPGSSVDVTTPDSPIDAQITATGNNSMNVQWTAPSSGIDGGGFMVIRYLVDPSGSTQPIQNGIYTVGSIIGNGTVAYIGTNPSFVDNTLSANANYFYRIYTLDKAYNYSSPFVISGITTNNSLIKNLTVTHKTLLAIEGDSVGIGTSTPTQKLEVVGNIKSTGKIMIGNIDTSFIGDYALAVNGTAIFTKAKVKLYSKWPDYVFDDNYDLPTLKSIEAFIRQNKHLPGVVSAKEAQKNGLDLGNNQAVLLQKIEELTLYLIEQNKAIEKLQAEVKSLKSTIK